MTKHDYIYHIEAVHIFAGLVDTELEINCHKVILNMSLDSLHLQSIIGKKGIETVLVDVSFDAASYVNENKKTIKVKRKELRKNFYENGFDLNGTHFVRYKRSAGSSRTGKCLFIAKKYYTEMNKWSNCGLSKTEISRDGNLVAYEAYRALSLSSIEKVIKIDPKSILVMKDYEHPINIENDSIGVDIVADEIVLKKAKEIKNNIWDGQGLLDCSVFNENGYSEKGMMLLRNRYFKCCAFQTDIKKFLDDHKDDVAKLTKLNGYMYDGKHIEDIKLIITESSLKYIKLADDSDETIKKWMDEVGDEFGVVKTDKPTSFFKGDMVYTSYQFLNTIGLTKEEAGELVYPFLDYRRKIREDIDVFRFYVENSTPVVTGNEYSDKDSIDIYDGSFVYASTVCNKLVGYNVDFQKTREYSSYRGKLTTALRENALSGHILISGTNATLFGSGYEMLLNAIFKFDKKTSLLGKDEVYSPRFADKEELVGARSPHITMGNLLYAKNKIVDEYKKYFRLSKEIVVVDAMNNNIQQKLNGCDYDSDFMLLTNNKIIVKAVKRNYNLFKVPVCLAKPTKVRKNEYEIDDLISSNKVGDIVNLSQKLNSLYWDFYNRNEIDKASDVYEYICKLAVLSGMEIDKAKRVYSKDNGLISSTTNQCKKVADYAFDDKKGTKKKPPMFFYQIFLNSSYKYDFIEDDQGKKVKAKLKKSVGDFEYYLTPMDFIYEIAKSDTFKSDNDKEDKIPLSALIRKDWRSSTTAEMFINEILKSVIKLYSDLRNLQAQKRFNNDDEAYLDAYRMRLENEEYFLELKSELAEPRIVSLLLQGLDSKDYSNIQFLVLFLVLQDGRKTWQDVVYKKPPKVHLVEVDHEADVKIFEKNYQKVEK